MSAATAAPQPIPDTNSGTNPATNSDATPAARPHVLGVMLALMMAMFVSMLAATVVSTSLPVILADLGGNQSAFTWVVTATLLATTVSTPIWGKLADLFNRKLLMQLALILFVVATAIAGFSTTPEMLIVMRVFQGLGAGGLAARGSRYGDAVNSGFFDIIRVVVFIKARPGVFVTVAGVEGYGAALCGYRAAGIGFFVKLHHGGVTAGDRCHGGAVVVLPYFLHGYVLG